MIWGFSSAVQARTPAGAPAFEAESTRSGLRWPSPPARPGCGTHRKNRALGFTLLEIMIVVCIMGILMTLGVPLVWKALHKAPMNKAIADVVEVCSNARRLAILQGKEVDLVFHPREGRLEVAGAAVAPRQNQADPGTPIQINAPVAGSGLSAQLPSQVQIEDLDINKMPGGFRDAETARVRFFPNGTSDEMSLFLLSDSNQRCEILLEVTTALASVEWDVHKFR